MEWAPRSHIKMDYAFHQAIGWGHYADIAQYEIYLFPHSIAYLMVTQKLRI